MRRENGIRYAVLVENVLNTEFSAIGIPAMSKIHFSDLIGIGLNVDRFSAMLQGSNRAVFIAEIGQRHNNAVILALMRFQPLGVFPTLLTRFDCTIARQLLRRDQVIVSCVGYGLYHFLSCSGNKTCREKSSVSEIQRKFHMYALRLIKISS